MDTGPGKYDELCTMVRERAEAQGVFIIVLEGKDGSGCSCQMSVPDLASLPDLLEQIARDIRTKGPAG